MLPMLVLATLTATAAPPPGPRHIVVIGVAREVARPNQATVRASLLTQARDLATAKKSGEERERKLLAALLAAGVERGAVQFEVGAPQADQRGVETIGWQQYTGVILSLKDLAKLDDAVTVLVKNGAIMPSPVVLENTEHEVAESKARIAAAANARERAKGMIEALGAKLGLPVTVSDSTPAMASTTVGAVQLANDGPVTTGWASKELITTSQVTVQFDIDVP
jgi:hypothetical protein